jgi:hypothetical protein
MVEIFTGRTRGKQAARFIEKIEAAGGEVYETCDDQEIETGVRFLEVHYEMPAETEEEDEE